MNGFLSFLKLDVFISIPQFFTVWFFCCSVLWIKLDKLIYRIVLIAVIHSVYTDLMVRYIPMSLHMLNSLLTQIALFLFLFRELNLKQKASLFGLTVVVSMASDLAVFAVMIYGFGMSDRDKMVDNHFVLTTSVIYLVLSILLTAAFIVRKRKTYIGQRLFSVLWETGKHGLTPVIFLIAGQFSLLGAVLILQTVPKQNANEIVVILIYAVIAVSLLALFLILRLLVRSRERAVQMTQDLYIEDINRMFASIRGQRHDFLNHVQVIHSMVQMGKWEQLKRYSAELIQETREVSEIADHASPALAAFIKAKMAAAVRLGIAFTYELPDSVQAAEHAIRSIDLIRILGNLVDNAFDEVSPLPSHERRVHAAIRSSERQLLLEVSNRGTRLTDEKKQQIFEPGYTTKKTGHSGLGLAIVLDRVRHYKGKVQIDSDDRFETVFRITLPLAES